MIWCVLFFVWCMNITFSESLTDACFNLQSHIVDKTCVDLVEFTVTGVRSKLRCAELCRGTCTGVFYSSTTKQCVGCKAMYGSITGLGTLQDSVYYIRRWHYEYIGCYQDCQNMNACPRRVMQHRFVSYSMTLEMCADHCKPYGLQFFGTQNGHSCFCGDDTYDIDGPATICNDACLGNSSQACGGWSVNSVYKFVFEC